MYTNFFHCSSNLFCHLFLSVSYRLFDTTVLTSMYMMSLFSTFLLLKLYIRGKIVVKHKKKINWKKAEKENDRFDKDYITLKCHFPPSFCSFYALVYYDSFSSFLNGYCFLYGSSRRGSHVHVHLKCILQNHSHYRINNVFMRFRIQFFSKLMVAM